VAISQIKHKRAVLLRRRVFRSTSSSVRCGFAKSPAGSASGNSGGRRPLINAIAAIAAVASPFLPRNNSHCGLSTSSGHVTMASAKDEIPLRNVIHRQEGITHAKKVAAAAPAENPPCRNKPVYGRQEAPITSEASTKDARPIPPTPTPVKTLNNINAQRKGAVAAKEAATPEIIAEECNILRGGVVPDNQCQIAQPKSVPRKKQPDAAWTNQALSQTRLNSDTREKPRDVNAQAFGLRAHKAG